MKKIAKFARGGRGFLLIDLMFGVFILLVVIIALLLTYSNCMFLTESNRNLTTAANAAEHVLEQIKALSYADIANYQPPAFTNLQVTVTPVQKTTTLSEVTVTVVWTERQQTRSFSLATYFAA